MEKDYAKFRVTLDEGLEVTGIRHSKIDATKQLIKETLPARWSQELILIVSELRHGALIPILSCLPRVYIRTPV